MTTSEPAPLDYEGWTLASADAWQAKLTKDLRGKDYATLRAELDGDLSLPPLQTATELADLAHWRTPLLAHLGRERTMQLLQESAQPVEGMDGCLCPGEAADAAPRGGHLRWEAQHPSADDQVAALERQPFALGFEPRLEEDPDPRLQGLDAGTVTRLLERCPRPVLVSDRHFVEAGADPALALGAQLSLARETLAALGAQGVAADRATDALEWEFRIGVATPLEVARLRAARLLWLRVLHGENVDPFAHPLHGTGRMSRRALLLCEPHSNLVRSTLAGLNAWLGGCDGIALPAFDRSRGADESALAASQLLLLRHESQLDAVHDPLAGSFTIETLTDRVARRAWSVHRAIEDEGGFGAALASGSLAKQVAAAADAARGATRDGTRSLVGSNRYGRIDAEPLEPGAAEAGLLFGSAGARDGAFAALRRRSAALQEPSGAPPTVCLQFDDAKVARRIEERLQCAGIAVGEGGRGLTITDPDQAFGLAATRVDLADALSQALDALEEAAR